jgi:hypothetical protein
VAASGFYQWLNGGQREGDIAASVRERWPLTDAFGSTGFSVETAGTERAAARARADKRKDMAEEIRDARRELSGRPTRFAEIAKLCDARLAHQFSYKHAELDMFDMLDLLNEPDTDPELERDRQIIVAWFRGDLSQAAFAKARGISPMQFSRRLDGYCRYLAHVLDSTGSRQRLWFPIWPASRDLITGLDDIARAMGRDVRATQRMIGRGELPVGKIHGALVANIRFLPGAKVKPAKPPAPRRRVATPKHPHWRWPTIPRVVANEWRALYSRERDKAAAAQHSFIQRRGLAA